MTALYIILGIIGFIVLLFSIKFTVYMNYEDEFTLSVRWLFIKLKILPKTEKPEKEKKQKKKTEKAEEEKPKEEPEPDKNEEKKPNIISSFYKNQGFSGVLQLIKDTTNAIGGMFGDIFKHLVFRELKLYMRVGADDAAQTAQLYGKTCGFVFPAMGLITSTCKVKEYDCTVEPNFIEPEKKAAFKVTLSYRPIFATNAVVVMAFKMLFKVVLKLLKNKPQEPKASENNTKTNNIKEDKK